jgi:hypothetical protein
MKKVLALGICLIPFIAACSGGQVSATGTVIKGVSKRTHLIKH